MDIKIVKSLRKTLALQMLPDGAIVAKAPIWMPDRIINSFIEKHKAWIEKRKAHLKGKASKREYLDGEEFFYLGKSYKLKIGDYSKISIYEDSLLVPKVMQFRIRKELTNWYIREAKEVIADLLKASVRDMKTSFGSVLYSYTLSKWGHCTRENNLQFSWRLIMAPLLVIRYVVIHELAHTIEKNHSRKFWKIVSTFNPSFKQQIRWLKDHGSSLVV